MFPCLEIQPEGGVNSLFLDQCFLEKESEIMEDAGFIVELLP